MKFAFALTVAAIAALHSTAALPAHGAYESHPVASPYGHFDAQRIGGGGGEYSDHHGGPGYAGALNHHEDASHLTVVNPEHSGHGFSHEQFVHGYDGGHGHYEPQQHAPVEHHAPHPEPEVHAKIVHQAEPQHFYGGHHEQQGELRHDGKIYGPVVRHIQEALPQIIHHEPAVHAEPHHGQEKHVEILEPKVTYGAHPVPEPEIGHVQQHGDAYHGQIEAYQHGPQHIEAHPEPHYAQHGMHKAVELIEPKVSYDAHPIAEPVAHHAVHQQHIAHDEHQAHYMHAEAHHGQHYPQPEPEMHLAPQPHYAQPLHHAQPEPEPAPAVPDHPDSYQGPHDYQPHPPPSVGHSFAVHDPSAYTAMQFVNHAYGDRPNEDFHRQSHEHFAKLFDSFYAHRMPGDGFGPGGHFSPMPKPELKMVPVPTPVDKPYPVPVDKPYKVPYIAKVIQPHIHKQTIVKSHITYKEHNLEAPVQHPAPGKAPSSAHNNFGLDYSIKK